jgi:peptidoglycan/LPS O-acetylase OafA/YrhL
VAPFFFEAVKLNEREMQPTHRPELDGLRGVAIAMVILFHYGWDFFRPAPATIGSYLLVPLRLMWSGVDLFFVLSGFLIIGILIRERNSPHYFSAFYGRRACRILPIYSLMLMLFIAGIAMQSRALIDWPMLFGQTSHWPTYVIFVQNFAMAKFGISINFLSPSWSLAIEEQMYIFLPLLIFALRKNLRLLGWTMIGMIFIAVAYRHFVSLNAVDPADAAPLLILPWARMDAFAVGGLLALGLQTGWLINYRWSYLSLNAGFLIGLVGMVASLRNNRLGTFVYDFVALTYGSLLGVIVLNSARSWLHKLLVNQQFQWLGKISYGLYLLHIPVLGIFLVVAGLPHTDLVGAKPQWITLAALATSLVLATLSQRYFESTITNWGRRRWPYSSPSN